ncbi:hypothetical protein V5H42_25765, partial [Salmonella enterica]
MEIGKKKRKRTAFRHTLRGTFSPCMIGKTLFARPSRTARAKSPMEIGKKKRKRTAFRHTLR